MPSRRPALDVISHSPDQTRQIGYRLGRLARPGDIYLLSGQVGGGKTTFVQGLARGLGVRGSVQSPTFALAMEHAGQAASGEPAILFHLDFYRLEGAEDLETFGYEEYLQAPEGIVAVEWPERLSLALPEAYLLVSFDHLAEAKRRLRFQPYGSRPQELVSGLREEVTGAPRRSAPAGDR
ncbi:MAG TPA: tRNA (adenosine(37)-N6)-threonylcarbamoyltransferase complex ATPase subunit type 1 TsaE [Thermomicrobiaceae bacterium]|nr:tRNA (adenosine(37)-N6)-threonylcarbamoyltransferase complex ATPase subunit type 1 TsaE [Thermomicrobiaceae bacterium]